MGRGFRADKIRNELQLPEGPIDLKHCDAIAERLQVTYSLFRIEDNSVECIQESPIVSQKHVNILLLDEHYWVIRSDMMRVRSICSEESMQIQQKQDTAPQCADIIVTTGESDVEERDLQKVEFKETLIDPSSE